MTTNQTPAVVSETHWDTAKRIGAIMPTGGGVIFTNFAWKVYIEARLALTIAAEKVASDAVVSAIIFWLEANQPDVFKRGLWDAIGDTSLSVAVHPTGAGEPTTAWLIELADHTSAHRWWCGQSPYSDDSGVTSWTVDANKAIRFSRKQDAELVMTAFGLFHPNHIVTEHSWV